MKVIEIFDSIDGEGIFAGCLATFIRLAGCNLRCLYCDTLYAMDIANAKEMSVNEILNECKKIGNQHITLTGGEPLIHKEALELVKQLCKLDYIVNIETNGSIDISPYQMVNTVITADYKTKFSGENKRMLNTNLSQLRNTDVLKIVCSANDFDGIEKLVCSTEIKAPIYLSPIFGEVEPVQLVDFLKRLRGKTKNRVKMQIQLHKIIWSADKRGV